MIDPAKEPPDNATTLATSIYERLKNDILAARLEPGQKLSLRFLMDQYGTGQTPLREALNRLVIEELVIGREQRGFSVTPISLEELNELTRTRCWVEGLGLRESMQNATPAWEEALLVAHHRLARTPRSLNPEQFEDNPAWEVLHRAFHDRLIENCASRPLIGFCMQLADRLYRYRMISIRKVFRVRKVSAEHDAILQAVLNHDQEQAVALLQAHYMRTAAVIEEDLRNAALSLAG